MTKNRQQLARTVSLTALASVRGGAEILQMGEKHKDTKATESQMK